MITPEEKEEIIQAATERALLRLPEVIGNLLAQHVTLTKLNQQFMKDHKDFMGHEKIVASIIEKYEGKNPLKGYDDILKDAVPEIREKIKSMRNFNTDLVLKKPSLKITDCGEF